MTDLRSVALDVLRKNDQGDYTIPTAGLYPHQWNWDSAFIALGWAQFDPERAWCELKKLLAAQCSDGLVAHIAFNPDAHTYGVGPQWWGNREGGDGRLVSGITQPPVAAMVLARLPELQSHRDLAQQLILALHRWHQWFLTVRDPDGRGEPVVVHPWESGRDNAVEWDEALQRCPDAAAAFSRPDTTFVASENRPTKEHYQRYMGLLESFATLGWDQAAMAKRSPFRVLDPGFSAILARSCHELAEVAEKLGLTDIAVEEQAQSRRIANALDARRDQDGVAWPLDLVSGKTIKRRSCFLALQLLQPNLDTAAATTLLETVLEGDLASPWGVLSTSCDDVAFNPRNYWRGPVWANITWLAVIGLQGLGEANVARTLRDRLLAAVTQSGFREYVEPKNGGGLGAVDFSWTAALFLDSLEEEARLKPVAG